VASIFCQALDGGGGDNYPSDNTGRARSPLSRAPERRSRSPGNRFGGGSPGNHAGPVLDDDDEPNHNAAVAAAALKPGEARIQKFEVWPGRYCSSRHRKPRSLRNEDDTARHFI